MSPLLRRRGAAAPEADPPAAPRADPPRAEATSVVAEPSAAAAPQRKGVAPRRPHAGLLRRERRALLRARATRLGHLGGLLLEMYRRGAFREDLLAEHCADVVGIDARLAEIDELLHARGRAPRCDCGAPILRGSHFCPNCGRPLAPASGNGAQANAAIDATMAESPPAEEA